MANTNYNRNGDIKRAIHTAGLFSWQVVAKLGISESTFARWMRMDLTADKKDSIDRAIKELKEEQADE